MQDGNPPWYFYNLMEGYGYGVSFFYGQLTLYPFLPIVYFFGYHAFVLSYLAVAIVVEFIGAWMLAKRLCDNPLLVATICVGGLFHSSIVACCGMFCYLLSQGFMMIFLAYSYDFFRYNKNMLKASLIFFIILGTNLMGTLISFLYCFGLCLLYFDKKRIKSYFVFAGVTTCICAYPLLNYFYHVPQSTHKAVFKMIFNTTCSDLIPFRWTEGYCLYDFITFCCVLYGWSKSKTIRGHLAFLCLFIYNVIGIHPIWVRIMNYVVWQFPFRPVMVNLLACTAIASRAWGKKLRVFLYWVALMVIIIPNGATTPYDNSIDKDLPNYMFDCINWEFLGEDAVSPGEKGSFVYDKQDCIYQSDGTKSIIRAPKYWYRGMRAYGENGEEFRCFRGAGMLTEVDITGYSGEVRIRYVHPYWLRVIGLVCYVIWFILIIEYFCLRRIGCGHYWRRDNAGWRFAHQ